MDFGLHPPTFSGDSTDLLEYISELEVFFAAAGLDITTQETRCEALLKHTGGPIIRKAVEVHKAHIARDQGEKPL